MRPRGSAELLEERRRRALVLLDEGLPLTEVGRRMECSPSSVVGWRNARRGGGLKALKVRFPPGRPKKLGAAQRQVLVRMLLKGAMGPGHATPLWTPARIDPKSTR